MNAFTEQTTIVVTTGVQKLESSVSHAGTVAVL